MRLFKKRDNNNNDSQINNNIPLNDVLLKALLNSETITRDKTLKS